METDKRSDNGYEETVRHAHTHAQGYVEHVHISHIHNQYAQRGADYFKHFDNARRLENYGVQSEYDEEQIGFCDINDQPEPELYIGVVCVTLCKQRRNERGNYYGDKIAECYYGYFVCSGKRVFTLFRMVNLFHNQSNSIF